MPSVAGSVVRWFWVLQAGLVAGWWLVLWGMPAARAWFGFGEWPEGVLMAFALPDAVLLVAGSALTASTNGRRRLVLAWLVTGGTWYAMLWCLAAASTAGGGWIGTGAMALLALGNLVAALSASSTADSR